MEAQQTGAEAHFVRSALSNNYELEVHVINELLQISFFHISEISLF